MKIGGKEINNWYIVGGAAGVVVVLYLYKKSASSSSSSSTAASNPNAIDPITGMPYSQDSTIDPITGSSYLQEAQTYGSVQAAEAEVTSGSAYYGQTGSPSSGVTSGFPTISGVSSGTPSVQSFSSNAQWAQAVTSGLVALGYQSQDVATALGLFFAQRPLGSASDGTSYASIIQAAEAEYGPPPQGTYSILPEPTNTPAPSPVPPTKPAPGKHYVNGTVTGLTAHNITSTSATLTWNPTPGATSYAVNQVSPKSSSTAIAGIQNTTFIPEGLKPNTSYTFYVSAEPATSGHAAITFKTT